MPVSKDRFPGEREDEGIILDNLAPGEDPTAAGGIRYVDGAFRLKDALGVFDPRSGGGIDAAAHAALDQLVHDIAEDSDVVITHGADGVTNVDIYTDSGHTDKIRDVQVTYAGGEPSVIVERQYAADGSTVLETLTHTLSYSSGDLVGVATVKT